MYGIRNKGRLHEIYDLEDGKTVPDGLHASLPEALAQLQALDNKYTDNTRTVGNQAPGKSHTFTHSLNLSYVKSLGLDDWPDLAVKSVGLDEISGYLALWGNPGRVDLDREFFTQDTDFWDHVLPAVKTAPRPLTWAHGQDDATKDDPVIGSIVDMGDDQVGRWYIAKLKRSHQYRKAIDRLIADSRVGTSSDSAPQYVLREKVGKAVWLKRWPLLAAALTEAPCEPRQLGTIDYYKSLGLYLPSLGEIEDSRQVVQWMKLKSFALKQWAMRKGWL